MGPLSTGEVAKAAAQVALTDPDPDVSGFAATVASVAALTDEPEETLPEPTATPPTASAEASLEPVPEETA
eukprot:5906597-Alexandrium_andersonii.AAC.1